MMNAGRFAAATMPESVLVASPMCQITRRAVTALEQADADAILEVGAFAEMGHLPAAQVLADGLQYAAQLLAGPGGDPADPALLVGLADRELLVPDALFLSQLLGLRDVAAAHGVTPSEAGAEASPAPLSLGDLIIAARDRFVALAEGWRREPGRRSSRFRVLLGERETMWPVAILSGAAGAVCPDPEEDVDAFALFAALPLLAPFLALEEDCFVAPRLE